MEFITFEQAKREYCVGDAVIKALNGIDFRFGRDAFNVVLGQSGAGKTTLPNLLGGMDSPTVGEVVINGHEVSGMSECELTDYRRTQIGFAFQLYNLVPNLTALENVQLAEEICPDPLNAYEMLQRVGLGERMNNFPSQMSGGEQQRVSIARALTKNPQIVLCDEPAGILNSETGRKMLRLIRDVANDLGKTVIIATHNAPITEMAQTVLHMRNGAISQIEIHEHPEDAEEIEW